MECFKIEWKGTFSYEDAQNRPEARESGIYAIHKPTRGANTIWYIGKSQNTGKRLSQHFQGFTHGLSEKEIQKISVAFGTIYSIEGSRTLSTISDSQLGAIESFFINTLRPEGNSPATKKGYKGAPLLIINTGKIKLFDKVMCHNTILLDLLKQNLPAPKKTRKASDYRLF